MTSEEIKSSLNVIKAVIEIQKKMKAIERTTDNTFFKSKYAPLEEVMKVIQPLLSEFDLALMHFAETEQTPEEVIETKEKNGETLTKRWTMWVVKVTTMLIHSSGEFMKDQLVIPVYKPDAQSIGQTITYARRYSILSMLAATTIGEDADGFTGDGDGEGQPARVERGTKTPEPSIGEKYASYKFEKPEIDIFKKAGLLTQTMIVKERENHADNKAMVAAMLARLNK
jgi:hypothetical protein